MKSALDTLIEELEAGTWSAPLSSSITGKANPQGTNWPSESLDAVRRFGHPHAKLFPFIGRKVRTPSGPGALLQVFADRVTVVLDSEISRCAFFHPNSIVPVSWELDDA